MPAAENLNRIVCAGRLSPEKGQADLVQALKGILASYPDTHVVFCGTGPDNDNLDALVRRLNVGKHVTFAGYRADIVQVFRWMDLLVLPSLSEGIPNVVLESMALGKPVVATRVGGVPEVIVDRETGYLADPANPESLGRVVCEALADLESGLNLGLAARRHVAEGFSFERQSENMVAMYDEVSRLNSTGRRVNSAGAD
jgi:glycosyltransferase involved in cell wall biosynthesis